MTDSPRPPRKAKRRGSRFKARRRAVEILFESEARDTDPVAVTDFREELSQLPEPPVPPVNPYTRQIVAGTAVELDRIDDTIAAYLAENWKLNRIPAVDRAILRVATWELLFNPEVPVKTAVVDAVELASQYSSTVAAPYVNGVLDAIATNIDHLRAEIRVAAAALEAEKLAAAAAGISHDEQPEPLQKSVQELPAEASALFESDSASETTDEVGGVREDESGFIVGEGKNPTEPAGLEVNGDHEGTVEDLIGAVPDSAAELPLEDVSACCCESAVDTRTAVVAAQPKTDVEVSEGMATEDAAGAQAGENNRADTNTAGGEQARLAEKLSVDLDGGTSSTNTENTENTENDGGTDSTVPGSAAELPLEDVSACCCKSADDGSVMPARHTPSTPGKFAEQDELVKPTGVDAGEPEIHGGQPAAEISTESGCENDDHIKP